MATTRKLDDQGMLQVTDTGTNAVRTTNGMEDLDQGDHLKVTGNGTKREVILSGGNDGESGTDIPLLLRGAVPDFRGGSWSYGDDCTTYAAGDWTLTQATTGTAALATGNYGVMELDSASSTADQGINLQHLASIPALAASQVVRFGCRVKIADGTNEFGQVFIGLSDTDTTIMAAGIMASSDYVGFFVDAATSAAGTVDFELYDGVTAENVAGVHTFVDDTYVDLEFVIDGVTTATPYVNGVAGTAITIADAPDTALRPSFVMQSEGTDDPIMSLDWWYITTTNR